MQKQIIIIEGPSGVGKDTIITELINRYPDKFGRPINATTRPMRENESQNNPYLFLIFSSFLDFSIHLQAYSIINKSLPYYSFLLGRLLNIIISIGIFTLLTP